MRRTERSGGLVVWTAALLLLAAGCAGSTEESSASADAATDDDAGIAVSVSDSNEEGEAGDDKTVEVDETEFGSNPDDLPDRSFDEWLALYEASGELPVADTTGAIVGYVDQSSFGGSARGPDVAHVFAYGSGEHIGYRVIGGGFVSLRDVDPDATHDEILLAGLGVDGLEDVAQSAELRAALVAGDWELIAARTDLVDLLEARGLGDLIPDEFLE